MASVLIMPKVGISVESCTITKWYKEPGDTVSVGEALYAYETDKIALDEEAKLAGVLLHKFAAEGEEVECLSPVCIIGNAGEDISELISASPVSVAETAPVEKAAAAYTREEQDNVGFIAASPRAKSFARDYGIDLGKVTPSGAHGRIIEKDVRACRDASDEIVSAEAAACVPDAVKAAEYTDCKMSGIRKAIAKSMTLSVTTIPQVTHSMCFDAADILRYRKLLKSKADQLGLENITVNDMVIYAVSRVLAEDEYHSLNSHVLEGDVIRTFKDVNIGVAVNTDRGLMVPTIFGADKLSLNEISSAAKRLASQCKDGSISPDLLRGASFTVSNLGSYGVESFTPIVNPPQVAILGVNAIMDRVRDLNGTLELYKALGLSLSYDHRAVDGAPASAFLKRLCEVLEDFTAILAK